MPVRGGVLGEELTAGTVDVTARMALAFAAGIGDVGPRTFDDAASAMLVASPSFCVRVEWGVLSAGRAERLGLDAFERLRAVHVEQDSTFHRPIRPGDRLTTRARIVATRSTSAGALVETRLATVDEAGEPIVTSWHSAIYRGVPLAGEAGRIEEPPPFPTPSSDLPEQVRIDVAREAGHVFTECAGIWNPIHSERRVALEAGLPDVVLHGVATWALAGREIVKAHAAGDPARLRRLRARFKSFVIPGTAITLVHGRGPAGDVFFRVANGRGEDALTEGYAQLIA